MDARDSTGVENGVGSDGETTVDIAVIGAGFSGRGAAIRLRQAGWRDFVAFEAADDIGGTRRDKSSAAYVMTKAPVAAPVGANRSAV